MSQAVLDPHLPLAPAGRLPPAPLLPGRPLVGHVRALKKDPLGLFLQAARVGDVVRVPVGPWTAHFIFHPRDIRRVLCDNHAAYDKQTRGYGALRAILGEGLVTSEGSFWKRQRRIAQPAFHKRRLAELGDTMRAATIDLAQSWAPLADGRHEVDVADAMMRLTLRIAGETLFGYDLSDETSEIGAAVTDMLRYFRAIFPSFSPLARWMPTPTVLRGRRALRKMDALVARIIAERRARPAAAKADLLGMLMDARDEDTGEGMTDAQLRDEIVTMLMAGHETTANALGWTLYLLSQHPAEALSVGAEIDRELDGRPPGAEDLRKLVYTDQVLSEAMRLMPPVWALARRAREDDVLGGYHVPKGAYVVFSPYATHRHPVVWADPDRFEPARFAPERLASDARAAEAVKHGYFPFSVGPRKCIGDHFARMEALIVLATLLGRYRLRLVPDRRVEVESSLTLRPRAGIWMTLTPRDPCP
jgi:cytochrome P450